MPRQLTGEMPIRDIEYEIRFTRAALKADRYARPLLFRTDGWMGQVDGVIELERRTLEQQADADAARIVANMHFDRACVSFGDDLYLATGKDRKSKRWLQFFTEAVSRFVAMALPGQVTRVRAWLTSKDPILDKHRAELTEWSDAAAQALADTRATGIARGETWQAREQMAEDLTRERDGLHAALVEIANQNGLPRDWPALFFRTATRTKRAPRSGSEPEDSAQE